MKTNSTIAPGSGSSGSEPAAQVPTFTEISSVLRSRWLAFSVVALSVVGLLLLATLLTAPTYQASAEVLLRTESTAQLFPLGGDDDAARTRSVNAELEYVRSDAFQTKANDVVRVDAEVEVTAKKLPATDRRAEATTLVFVANAPSAAAAAEAADGFAETYVLARSELDLADHDRRIGRADADLDGVSQRLDELQVPVSQIDSLIASSRDLEQTIALLQERTRVLGQQSTERTRLESELSRLAGQLRSLQVDGIVLKGDNAGAIKTVGAEVPTAPKSPNLARNLVLGVLLGALAGVTVALWLERSDTTLRDPGELASTGHALLGVLPASGSSRPDSLRSFATSVDFAARATDTRVIQVLSATAGEGAETVAGELAVTLARFDRNVVLIDADIRRDQVAEMFGVDSSLGFTDMLIAPIDALETTGTPGLSLLSAGSTDRDPAELLAGSALPRLVAHLRAHFDFVVVSSPELLGFADSRIVGREVDGVILVAGRGAVKASDVSTALDILESDNTAVLGTLYNGDVRATLDVAPPSQLPEAAKIDDEDEGLVRADNAAGTGSPIAHGGGNG
ncbi:MAG: CpsD/CapB family tyrosine-protein kinase [Acidimicrobiales bacterium]